MALVLLTCLGKDALGAANEAWWLIFMVGAKQAKVEILCCILLLGFQIGVDPTVEIWASTCIFKVVLRCMYRRSKLATFGTFNLDKSWATSLWRSDALQPIFTIRVYFDYLRFNFLFGWNCWFWQFYFI